MGSASCVAAKERTIPTKSRLQNVRKSDIDSPSWTLRRDNTRRVASEINDHFYQTYNELGGSVRLEPKCSLGHERGDPSTYGSSRVDAALVTPNSLESPCHEALITNPITSDESSTSDRSFQIKNSTESPATTTTTVPNVSVSSPSAFSTTNIGHFPNYNHNYCQVSNSVTLKGASSPGHPLLRHISDSGVLKLKSLDDSIAEGRPSVVFSSCGNDIAALSQGGSSDDWSMHTFSEPVPSSQGGRWSFDSEHFCSSQEKFSGYSSLFPYSTTTDLQSCGVCSKLLADRSLISPTFIACSDTAVVAILVCGHVYHAECLESLTVETDKYDPACPVCMFGEKQALKLSRKASRADSELKVKSQKISKNRVVHSYLDWALEAAQEYVKRKGKASKIGANCSARDSSGKSFLKRHFSLGSKWGRSVQGNDDSKRKGFWARYLKD